jgi:PilZ domain
LCSHKLKEKILTLRRFPVLAAAAWSRPLLRHAGQGPTKKFLAHGRAAMRKLPNKQLAACSVCARIPEHDYHLHAGDLHGKQTKEYDEAQGHIRIGIVIQDARSLPSPKMAVMNGTQTDRRSTRRLALRIPLRLSIWQSAGPEQRAESIDLSERGVLLVTDSALQIGTEVEVYLKIPKEITGEPEIEWCCRGRVVRIVPDISFNGPVTAGVHFDWLQILRR